MRQQIILFLSFLVLSIATIAQPKYEFRGVWIATVENIDFPSSRKLSSQQQKDEFIRLLDMHKRNGMNAIIMQIRPTGDAFYPSEFEPWSEYLTGEQGKAPSPYYDPLQFMIEETHKRGMEFHAWLNPYRAVFNINRTKVAPSHIVNKKPNWFLNYGDKKYFDPGNTEAQDFVVGVVRDIVKRYEVDAIHMDDYFYPYKIAGKEFPDEQRYRNAKTNLKKDDWRRANVDSIIHKIHRAIRAEKKYVQFGISPFGVWRNKAQDPERGSDSRAGMTNYDDLYADILLWMEKGWIDYVTPQLYREIDDHLMDYKKLTDWWGKYSYGKNVYIGHGIYRATEKNTTARWRDPNQIPNQIKYLRNNKNVQGSIFFSSISFSKNPHNWNDSLRNNYYKFPALLPPMPWLDDSKPLAPIVSISRGSGQVEMKVAPHPNNQTPIKYYVIYKVPIAVTDNEQAIASPQYIHKIELQKQGFTFKVDAQQLKTHRFLITAVGRSNVESEISVP